MWSVSIRLSSLPRRGAKVLRKFLVDVKVDVHVDVDVDVDGPPG
jgi:hypothetical protein